MATDEVAVIIPWRAAAPDRQAALDYLWPRLGGLGDVVLGSLSVGPWCKAAAVDSALPTDAEILVIHDADVWCDGTQAALDAVRDGAPWAIPHLNVYRLDAESTAATMAGGPLGVLLNHRLAEKPYRGHEGGGIIVIRRTVYEDCPLDPRFTGWGHEDDSWALALRCLHGAPWRGKRPLWHLWHAPQDRKTRRIGSDDNRTLFRQYRLAATNPDRMRELLADADPPRVGAA